tara:strand:- start:2600 stop:3496 length:897 start_codon:yes stop_codon:yes gene_type:complete
MFSLNLNNLTLSSITNEIIIKIDNKIITNLDIDDEIKYLKALNPNLKNLTNDKIFEIAKNSLIKEKIKEIEIFNKSNESVDENYLNNVIERIYKNIGLPNETEFIRYLNSHDVKIETVENKLANEALWNQIIYKKFFSKVKIDKDKIKNEIKNNKSNVNSYLLYEIIFNIDENSKLNEVYNKIKKSISINGFENTASIFSISDSSKTGGRLGWINESSINKKIQKQIINIKIGEFTKPIIIPGGFLILQVKDKKQIEQEIDINSEIKLKIRALRNQQLNQYSNIYFNKIKKNITIYEK